MFNWKNTDCAEIVCARDFSRDTLLSDSDVYVLTWQHSVRSWMHVQLFWSVSKIGKCSGSVGALVDARAAFLIGQ